MAASFKNAKLHLLETAAIMAAGVHANLPDNLALDENIADPAMQRGNIMLVRNTHIFYAWLVLALDNDLAFPPPKGFEDAGDLVTSGLAALVGPGGTAAGLADLLKNPTLVAALKTAIATFVPGGSIIAPLIPSLPSLIGGEALMANAGIPAAPK